MPIKNVYIDSITVTANKGIEIVDGENIAISQASINVGSTDLASIEYSKSIQLEGITTKTVSDKHFPFVINQSKNITIMDFEIEIVPDVLAVIKGYEIENILLDKNSFKRSQILIPDKIDPELIRFE